MFGNGDLLSENLFNVVMFDAGICFYLIGLMLIVTIPGILTFTNVQRGTSQVLKLKQQSNDETGVIEFEMTPEKQLTL